MRPTLCGEVKQKKCNYEIELGYRNGSYALGWAKNDLSPYSEDICAWNVHLHRDVDFNIVVSICEYTYYKAC
jgi:hypothetical protein